MGGCGVKIAKLIMFAVNFAVWVCSLCLLGFGIWMMVQSSDFDALFSEDNLTTVAIIFVTLGSLAFLVGFTGCCGALRDSIFLLRLYFILMLLIVLGEATGSILAFVFKDDVEESMTKGMTKAIKEEYNVSTAATESVDWVQKELALKLKKFYDTSAVTNAERASATRLGGSFECCGASNYTDYTDSVFQRQSSRPYALPDSCCEPGTETNTCSYGSDEKYGKGCVEASVDTIEDNALVFGLVCLGFVAVEIFAMVIACCLISAEQAAEKYEAV